MTPKEKVENLVRQDHGYETNEHQGINVLVARLDGPRTCEENECSDMHAYSVDFVCNVYRVG